MRIMEMLDRATFAQVPLRLIGDPELPVEVRPGADDLYKVGVSSIWRLGKKMLGAIVPMRFHARRAGARGPRRLPCASRDQAAEQAPAD